MIVAIASGKGGTGKTTVAASLFRVWDTPVTAVDLDVEEPNLHLFLRPEWSGRRLATLPVPVADQSKCTACRECSDLCQFKAIAVLGDYVMVFPEMCHGCGGCMAVCPEGAIAEGERELGEVLRGRAEGKGFLMGRLRIGEAMSPPLMKEVVRQWDREGDAIIDAPPGTSCPATEAVSHADVIILVSEPTPFGHHDLRLAHQAFLATGRPMGVVVNRAGLGDRSLYDYCREAGLPILLEIPFDRSLAHAYSEGRVIADVSPDYRESFRLLAGRIREMAGGEAAGVAHD